MAFSCKRENIDRCLGLDVSAPAPGSLAGLLARLSRQLKIISPRMYLAFIFHSIIFFPSSIMAAIVSVPSTIYSYELLGMKDGGSKEQEEEEEEKEEEKDRVKMGEVNPVMQKPDPAGSQCKAAC